MIDFLSIVGTRPQYIKLKPLEIEMQKQGASHIWIDTGQHYSNSMASGITEDLELSQPLLNLNIGSGSHGYQTGTAIIKIEEALLSIKPRLVIVYGDTNSTLAGAIAASKLNITLAHVEAGLRSFNKEMPEEINRLLVDKISDLNFAPTERSVKQLVSEGLGESAILTGDITCDLIRLFRENFAEDAIKAQHDEYLVLTLHRTENLKDSQKFEQILRALSKVDHKIRFYIHPHTAKVMQTLRLTVSDNIEILEPLPYLKMLKTLSNAAGLITDSGGLQKEAYLLGIPCTTLRNETEWIETLENNWNILIKNIDELPRGINLEVSAPQKAHFGNGHTANKIVRHLKSKL